MKSRIIYGDSHTELDLVNIKNLIKRDAADSPNYSVENWEEQSSSFLNVFLKQQRFSRPNDGGLVLVEDGDKLCGISGFNRSEFSQHVYLLGCRTLVDSEFRHNLLMSRFFVPTQLEAVKNKAKLVTFTFDTSNKFSLFNIFTAGKLNLFLQNKLGDFIDMWDRLEAVPFPVRINNASQNVLFIRLDADFDYKWEKIRA
jgi:hypothetical protein